MQHKTNRNSLKLIPSTDRIYINRYCAPAIRAPQIICKTRVVVVFLKVSPPSAISCADARQWQPQQRRRHRVSVLPLPYHVKLSTCRVMITTTTSRVGIIKGALAQQRPQQRRRQSPLYTVPLQHRATAIDAHNRSPNHYNMLNR